MGLQICAVGSYLPETIAENADFAQLVDTSDEWIRTRTGISSRHVADEDTAWSMGLKAARQALERANVQPEEIDLIIVTTVSPDYATPSISCLIQGELGAEHAACLDINCACAGFVYGLDMANRYMAGGDDIHTVLVVSTEHLTRFVDYTDRATCVLFGDGAGACVVRASTRPFASRIRADGRGAALMFCKYPTPSTPFDQKPRIENEISRHPADPFRIVMDGREVYKFATTAMPAALREACGRLGIGVGELDWIIPHQANIRIVQTAMKNLGLPMSKAYVNIDHMANTSSASIPVALAEMQDRGMLKPGNRIGLVGFGAGLIYAAAVVEW